MTIQATSSSELEYAGFWVRVWASVIDSIVICLFIYPVLTAIYGSGYWEGTQLVKGVWDILLSWVAPAIAVMLFWLTKQATPGKMAVAAQVVDARTGGKPSGTQLAIRYLGYFVAAIPLFLGLLWVAFDPRKQGWHDKLAGTVVVRKRGGTRKPVVFESR